MALIPTTSNLRIKEQLPGLFIITVNLVLYDDVALITVLDQDFSEEYSETQKSLAQIRMKLGIKMQDAINSYKKENALISIENRDNAIAWWNANLTG